MKRALATGMVLACLVGCSSKKGDVSGTVRFEGEVLPRGRITFYCEGGEQPVLMSNIVDGSYAIEEAPIGNSKITVETFQIKTTRVPGQIDSPTPDDVDTEPKEQPELEGDVAPTTKSGKFIRLPDRYSSLSDSKLTLQIDSGPNHHDVDLEK